MIDKYRILILEQVEAILEKKPSKDTLYELLKVTSPKLDREDVKNNTKRSTLLKKLKLRIHPDKLENDRKAVKLFSELDDFFNACVIELCNSQKMSSDAPKIANTSSSITFDSMKKWPQLLSLTQSYTSSKLISSQVAYQCVNARGAIAHGRKPELLFSIKQDDPILSVKEVFDKHGGSVEISDTSKMKEQLRENGPIVSTSFVLTEGFFKINSAGFDRNLIGEKYPILIIGWDFTECGEVWLVQPLHQNSTSTIHRIAFGQFGIDEKCIAPKNNFLSTPWQSGPYFDLDLSSVPEWRTWADMLTNITSARLEELGEILEDDFISASKKRKRFVIRDSTKIAHSEAFYLESIQWQKDKKKWKVDVKSLN